MNSNPSGPSGPQVGTGATGYTGLRGGPTGPTGHSGPLGSQPVFPNLSGTTGAPGCAYLQTTGGLVLIQWATYLVLDNATWPVTFNIPFPNACDAIVLTNEHATFGSDPVEVSALSASGFTITNGGSSNIPGFYFAIGH